MDFNQDILAALQSGKDHHALLEVARRYQLQGQTDQEIYQLLEQVWLDFGFDESDHESTVRNELETLARKLYVAV